MADEKWTAKQYREYAGRGGGIRRPFQPNLSGQKVSQTHSNLGKEFQDELDKTHKYYRTKGIADVVKNAEEWRYVGKSSYEKFEYADGGRVAKTASGRYLMKYRSDVDYTGNLKEGGRFICFDAKQIKGKSLPIGNIKEHQIRILAQKEQTGGYAGILVLFSDLDRVFWLDGSKAEEFAINALYFKGRKSIPVSVFETDGREVFRNHMNLWDWVEIFN